MYSSIKTLSLILLFTIGGYFAQAQNIEVSDVTNFLTSSISECGSEDIISIEVTNCCATNTATDVFLTVDLPNLLDYVSMPLNTDILSVNSSDLNEPVFNLKNIAVNETITFDIKVRARCGANAQSDLITDFVIDYLVDAVPGQDISEGQNLIGIVKKPSIQLEGVSGIITTDAVIGQTFDRTYKVYNTGIGSFLESFEFESNMEDNVTLQTLKVNGTTVTPTIDGSKITYTVNQTMGNVDDFPSHEVLITETLLATDCTNSNQGSTSYVRWGCDDSTCEQEDIFPNVQTPQGSPDVEVTLELSTQPVCWDETGLGLLTFTNSGTGLATDIQYDLDNRHNEWDNNYIVESSFKIQKEGAAIQNLTLDNATGAYSGPACFSGGSVNSRFYFSVPDMQPGDIYYVTFDYQRCVLTAPNPACDNEQLFEEWYGNGSFEGPCNFPLVNFEEIEFNAERFHWDGTFTDAPLDMDDGDVGTVEFEYTDADLEGYTTDGSAYVEIKIDLPPGLCLSGENEFGFVKGASNTVLPTSIDYTQSTGIILLQYPTEGNNFNDRRIAFDVTACCEQPGTTSAWQDITAQAFFEASDNCSSDTKHTLNCLLTTPIRIHCDGGNCNQGLIFKSFTSERTTFGLGDDNDNGQASGSLDMSLIRLDRLLMNDEFEVEFKGDVLTAEDPNPQSFSHAYAKLQIPSFGAFVSNQGASVTIYDASADATYTCSEIGISQSGTTWTFDVSASTLSAASCADLPAGYAFEDGDKITVTAQYKVTGSFSDTKIAIFDTDFYVSNAANGTKYQCNNYAERMTAYGYAVSNMGNLNHTVYGCDPYTTGNYNKTFKIGNNTGAGSRQFPYEFRNTVQLKTLVYQIPENYTLESLTIKQRRNTGSFSGTTQSVVVTPSSIGGSYYTFDLSEIYTVNGGTLPLPDEGIRLTITPSFTAPCTAQDESTNISVDYDAIFLDNQIITKAGTASFAMSGPNLSFQILGAQTSQIKGVEPTETVSIRIRNNSSKANASNVFFSLKSPASSIQATLVKNLTAGTDLVANSDFFEVGSIPKGGFVDLKVHFTYDICYLVDFDLYTGWGCDGYPANIFANNCGLTNIQLGLDPIEPELQTQVLNKAYIFTDLCEELTFDVKVSNRDPGVALNPTLDVKLPTGANMSIVSGFSTVTYKGQVFNSEPVSLGNNLYRWDINDIVPLIEANGVRPYAEKPDNDFFASVKIASGCGYISGSTIQFIANGEKSCGDPLLASTDATLPIKLNSAADYAQIYTPQIIQDLEDREHFTINVINQTGPDGDATSSDDHVYLVLPTGYSYTSGNIEFLKNAPTTVEPMVNTVDGATRLEWDFPANLAANDTMIWEIDLNVDDLIVGCEDVNVFQAQTVTDLTDTCVATGQECGVLVASKDESFYFSKCSGTGTGLKSGLESNGNLAHKIALRNWNNREQNTKTIEERARVEFLPRFNKAAMRNSHSMKKSAAPELINFIPEKGLYRTQAYISTPGDLANITNAEDIFAVDYMRDDNRFGAMLAIKTSEAVYEHSKVICDRFSGATLLGMEYLTIRNHSFIRYLLEQEDGSREYGISFVANTEDDANYTIDNQWILEQYKGTGTNYNFQVWSKTPDLTTNLVEKVLKLLAAEGDLYFKNTANPPLPDVYVRNARYENGRLYMDIQNNNGATEIVLNGNFKRTETSERESLELVLPITTESIQTIETDIGSVYDIGFSMGNNLTPQIDQLYMADGIWFLDYDLGLETINHYEVLPFDANLEVLENATSVYEVERDIQLDASVKSYISIIRNLRSRDRSMDLTPYDVLRFKVKGQGTLAINLVKANLRMADQQFKRKVLLSGEEQLVEIPLADFLNDYGAAFTNDNVLSLVFTMIGDGENYQEVSLDIKDVLFAKTAQSEQAVFATNSVGNYPNPFSEQTTVFFSLAENAPVVFSVYDAGGRLVHQQSADLLQGKNRIPFSGNRLQPGIYFYSIESVEAGLLLNNKMVILGN